MSKVILLQLGILFSTLTLCGQGIEGQITDERGEALSFATVYIVKLQKGTASNLEGKYQLALAPGNYEVRFQFLGYRTQTVKVSVGSQYETVNIQMEEEPLELQTIEILDNQEDPAYTIMRRAIAKASYHAQQLDSYTATSYIKGSGRLKDVPNLFRKRIQEELKKEGIDSSTAFVTESVSEVSYQRPNQFSEKVISIRTVGEDNNTSPNRFINSSFYLPEVSGSISPLSPKAFAYYKFEYLGFFPDHGLNINKIRVIPRSPGDKVFSGIIYIVDHYWSLHSLDLTTHIWGIKFNINQVYEPIKENVWLPVNQIFDVSGSFFGFDFEYNYFAHIRDYQITLNPELPEEIIVLDDKMESTAAKEADDALSVGPNQETLKALESGQEVSRKQLRKMLREYEKQEMKEEMAEIRDTAEVEVVSVSTFTIDSQAYRRDTSYWEEIRPIPLTQYEVKGYARMDSISRKEVEEQHQQDTLKMTIDGNGSTLTRKNRRQFSPEHILLGGSYKAGSKVRFGWEAPVGHFHFNTVEGYHIAFPWFVHNISQTFKWRITPTMHYSFARKRFNGTLGISLASGKSSAATLRLVAGRRTRAYNPDAITPTISDLATLIWERNYMKVYEQTYARVLWTKSLNTEHLIKLEATIAERRGLQNRTDHTYFDRDSRSYTSNFPANAEVSSTFFDTSTITVFTLGWQTEPWQKYRLRNGKKVKIDHSSPIFSFEYQIAPGNFFSKGTGYQHVDITVKHKWSFGVRGDLSLQLNTGSFFNKKNLTIIDFKHFPGNRTFLTTQNPAESFRLLDYYRYSTMSSYAAVFAHYQFRKFLITRIPAINFSGIKEAAFINLLESKGAKHYVEIGYGLNYIFRVFRIEGVANFLDGRYQSWGIRLGIASNLEDIL